MIWVLLFLILVLVTVIVLQWRELAHRKRVIEWCDERERHLQPLIEGARYAMASNIPPQSSFRAFFVNGMLSKNGVDNAHHLLEQHESLITAHRGVIGKIRDAYERLARWEQSTPVPQKGVKIKEPKVKDKPTPRPELPEDTVADKYKGILDVPVYKP